MRDRVQQRLESFLPKPSVKSPQLPDPLLLGSWQVTTGSYKGRWTFSANGTVTFIGAKKHKPTLGTWKMDSGVVVVRWTEETWFAFRCPLNLKDTSGDSWLGDRRERLTANKLLK